MTGPIEDLRVTARDVEGDLALIQRLAELRGDRVTIVPPAQGGWEVIVGTTRSFPQIDLLTALHVTARRFDVAHGPCAQRCTVCGSVMHLEFGRLRCRSCPAEMGSSEEGGA